MSISYNSKTFTLATTETFNGELEKKDIPRETRAIYLGYYFNQEIKVNILPNTLDKIVFGHRYNKEIKKGVLPKSITYLELGHSYSYKIDIGVLPKNLRHFTISNYKYVQTFSYDFATKSHMKIVCAVVFQFTFCGKVN